MKKADKKGKKGADPKELDRSLYIRHPTDLGEVNGVHAEVQRLVGRIANIEDIFPPWNIEGENWDEPIAPADLKEIIYPKNLKISSTQTIAELFNLRPPSPAVDPKSKKKDKQKEDVVVDRTEKLVDENGNPLPVLFRDDIIAPTVAVDTAEETELGEENDEEDNGHLKHPDLEDDLSLSSTDRPVSFQQFRIPRGFRRSYSEAQICSRNEQDSLRRKIAELEAASAEEGSTTSAKQIAKLRVELATSQEQHDIEAEGPRGDEVDAFVCQAYRMLQRFVAVVVKQTRAKDDFAEASTHETADDGLNDEEQNEDTNTKKILAENYLWRSIYPKLPTGKPYLNPSGKYCVKLYLAGKWRKVYVDDCIPLRADGLPALASSDDRYELWPIILTKAIYTVYSACGYSTMMPDITEEQDNISLSQKHSDQDTLVHHPVCHKISQFVAFIMHLSTGWQPHTPISMALTFRKEKAKSAKLLQDIIAEGVCKIDEADMVADESLNALTARTDTDDSDEFDAFLDDDDDSVSTGSSKGLGEAIKRAASAASVEASNRAINGSGSSDGSGGGSDCMSPLGGMERGHSKKNLHPVHRYNSIEEGDEREGTDDNDDSDGDSSSSSSNSSNSGSDDGQPFVHDVQSVHSLSALKDLPDGTYRTTKRLFKHEYKKRYLHRTLTEEAVLEREQKIAKISAMLDHMLTEITFLVLFDPTVKAYRTVPLLGISYNSDKPYDLMRVRFLVEWQTSKPVATIFEANPTPEDPESNRVGGVDEGPLPLTTPLKQEWMSVRELVRRNAFLIGLDTQTMTTHGADICWHWVPLTSLPEEMLPPLLEGEAGNATTTSAASVAGKKGTANNSSGSGADSKSKDNAEWFAYAGATPITLLKFNTKDFFVNQKPSQQQGGGVMQQRQQPQIQKMKFLKRQGSSAELVARAMNDLARNNNDDDDDNNMSDSESPESSPRVFNKSSIGHSNSGKQPKREFMHFSVTIHADVVTEYHELDTEALNEADKESVRYHQQPGDEERDEAAIAEENEITGALKFRQKYRKLPSDVTLVLQEIRLDNVVPMIFVMDLKDHAFLPVVTKSFAISSNRLPKNSNEPLIFWVRLFSKTSVYVHFSSEVEIEIDEAEKIWSDLGRPVFKREGQMGATRQKTQQLIFRLPLVIDQSSYAQQHQQHSQSQQQLLQSLPGSPQGSRPGTAATTVVAATGSGSGSNSRFNSPHGSRPGTSSGNSNNRSSDRFQTKCAMSFLFVHDRQIERNISLATLPHDNTKSVSPFPRIQGNLLQMTADAATSSQLLARVFPAYLPDCEFPIVRPFYWKLLVLSEQPLQEPPKPIHLDKLSQRYFGRYFSNNRRFLFRDVYTIEKYSFPLAFRLVTRHKRPPSRSKEALEMKAKQMKQTSLVPHASHSTQSALRKALQVKNRTNDLTLILRLYRHSDMKLIAELTGREGVLCYHLPLAPFLEDGETFDVAAETAKRDAAATAAAAGGGGKAKKPPAAAAVGDKKKPDSSSAATAAGASGDAVKVLMECVMDEYTMNIPIEWCSRFPHMFDIHFGPHISDAEQDMDFNDPHLADAVQKLKDNLEDQRKLLCEEPPFEPQVHWKMDMLAGKVAAVAHDTAQLEQQLQQRNQWEEAQAGRAERAAAAKAYFIERRVAETAQATLFTQFKAPGVTTLAPPLSDTDRNIRSSSGNSRGTRSSNSSSSNDSSRASSSELRASLLHTRVALTPSMSSALVIALAAELEQTKKRYSLLHSIPKYVDTPSVLHAAEENYKLKKSFLRQKTKGILEDDNREEMRAQHSQEMADLEVRFQDISSRFLQLNTKLREETKERVEQLLQQSSDDSTALAQQWQPRQQFREFAAARNESLLALLQRAAEAKAAALRAEEKAAEEAAKLAEKLRKEEEKKAKKKK